MIDTKYLDEARRIKSKNNISAPINDIIRCISEIKETGVNKKSAEKMVVNMFKNKEYHKYQDIDRKPNKTEILIYNISDEFVEIVKNPE